jgi:glycosyltransferase involved in cell wall biosynthesis
MKNSSQLKLSIIVASMNSERAITKTIESIKRQNYENIEVIFIDGGSSDETLKIINECTISDVKVVSEPDEGIADAWNKGLNLCSGDVITMLNSDDYYDDGVIEKVMPYFTTSDIPLIGFGDVTLINEESGDRSKVFGKSRGKIGLLNGFGFLHPSVFFNRKALDSVGAFNKKISVAMDTDWLLRAYFGGVSFKKIPSHTFMLTGGVSDVNKYTGVGEYLDALIRQGYSRNYVLLFFAFRFLGHLKGIFTLGRS